MNTKTYSQSLSGSVYAKQVASLWDYSDVTARYPGPASGPDMPDKGQDRDLAKFEMLTPDPLDTI